MIFSYRFPACVVAGICILFIYTEASNAQLADSPWPSRHNGMQNTGLSKYKVADKGNILWKYNTNSAIVTPPAIGTDGTIYVGSGRFLYALNSDGTMKWKYATDEGINHHMLYGHESEYNSPAIGSDGTIYVSPQGYLLFAINPDGTKKWKFNTDNVFIYTPNIGSNGVVYIGGVHHDYEETKLYAINPNGTLKWEFTTTDGFIFNSVAISKDGTVYAASGSLYAISSQGKELWSVERIGPYSSVVLDKNETLYASADSLYAITTYGTKKWSFPSEPLTPAIDSNGIVYTTHDNSLFAINPDGTEKWRVNLKNDSFVVPPIAIGAEGKIITVSVLDSLYAFSPDGSKSWSTYVGSQVVQSGLAISSKGSVYVSTKDSSLYAIGEKLTTNIKSYLNSSFKFRLKSNYPNPFNPSTNISFDLPKATKVQLRVYNTLGQKIATIVNKQMTAGSHSVTFNADGLPSGVYIYRLKVGEYRESRKMLLVK